MYPFSSVLQLLHFSINPYPPPEYRLIVVFVSGEFSRESWDRALSSFIPGSYMLLTTEWTILVYFAQGIRSSISQP